MNAVEEAARIAEARFAALATSVMAFDPIIGDLTWKNNTITPGQEVLVGYGFGTYDPAAESFTFTAYIKDGVPYICGSAVLSPAPAQGSSKTENISSYAPYTAKPVTFDVLCFIASGTLGLLSQDFTSGARIIGLKWEDFQNLSLIADKIFEDVLAVAPAPAAPTEISAFAVRKA